MRTGAKGRAIRLGGVREQIPECVSRRVLHHEHLADPPRQNKRDPAVADLLVLAHMRQQTVGGYAGKSDRGKLRRESHPLQVTAYPLRFGLSYKTQPNRKVEG